MSDYKLLVSDLDGTLFNKDGYIADEDLKAVHSVTEKGYRYAFASGRVIDACKTLVGDLRVNAPCVYFDGALVYDAINNNVIYENPLDKQLVQDLIDYTHEKNIYLELFTKEMFLAERPNWSDEVHAKFFHSHPHFVSFEHVAETESIMKAELLSHSEEEDALDEELKKVFDGRCRFSLAVSPSFPDVKFLNILDNQSSKGVAIKKIAEHLEIPISQVVAIGDGYNDIPMLKEAGLSVAMGNAFDDVKAISDYVTDTVDNFGVSQAIQKFFK